MFIQESKVCLRYSRTCFFSWTQTKRTKHWSLMWAKTPRKLRLHCWGHCYFSSTSEWTPCYWEESLGIVRTLAKRWNWTEYAILDCRQSLRIRRIQWWPIRVGPCLFELLWSAANIDWSCVWRSQWTAWISWISDFIWHKQIKLEFKIRPASIS